MIVLVTLLAVILAFLFALFLLKIRFLIDTEENVFQVSQGLLYKVEALTDVENPAKLKIRILGIPFVIDPMKIADKKKERKKPEPKKKTKRKRKTQTFSVGNSFEVIQKSIKIQHLYISLDSGDFVYNAQLFPSVYLLNQKLDNRYWFEINFIGENYLKINIESRPIWVVIAFIKLKYNQTKNKEKWNLT